MNSVEYSDAKAKELNSIDHTLYGLGERAG